jgi:hypothetical protein
MDSWKSATIIYTDKEVLSHFSSNKYYIENAVCLMRYSPLFALGMGLGNFPRRHEHAGGTVETTTNNSVIVTTNNFAFKNNRV